VDTNESIKQKILALMAKTTENGCSEEEAMAASAKVQELLNKYQLSLSDIKIREAKCVQGQYDTRLKGHSALEFVMAAIGKFTDTNVWFSKYGGEDGRMAYKFFGLEHDVLIAEYVTKLCDWAIIYGGEDFKDHDAYRHASNRSKVLYEFRVAMAYRLSARLFKMKEEQERRNASDGRSLVVVKSAVVTEEWAKLNMNLRKSKAKSVSFTSAEAYRAGTEAGDRVAINPGVSRGTSPQELT